MTQTMELWLTAGSTYTYLTCHRVEDAAQAAGVSLEIRPFYLGQLFREAGYWPFHADTPKMAYMWHDIARSAAAMGLHPSLPAPYPAPATDAANRILMVTIRDGLGLRWLRESYREWFENGHLPGDSPNVDRSLAAAGCDPQDVLARAEDPEIDAALAAHTDTARRLGIFGAPTFRVGDELFWGSDRLDQALAWARGA